MSAAVAIRSDAQGWTQNLFWLVKREVWEHRALYLAPGVLAALLMIMTVLAVFQIGNVSVDSSTALPGEVTRAGIRLVVYLGFAAPFAAIAAIVSIYYCLDALYAERRDRSVLFWKSLPISDLQTVLSKLAVAALVVPLIAVTLSIATQLFVFAGSSISLALQGRPWTFLWTQFPVVQNVALVLYMLVTMALWYLPIWAWCLLASAWARRAPFLWAVAPVAAAWFIEYQMFGTHEVGQLLLTRLVGVFEAATNFSGELLGGGGAYANLQSVGLSDVVAPARFFASGQLWSGLAAAAAFVAATVWVRRYRDSN